MDCPIPVSRPRDTRRHTRIAPTVLVVLVATAVSAAAVELFLEDSGLAGALVSRGLWADVVSALGGVVHRPTEAAAAPRAVVPFLAIFGVLLAGSVASWLAGAGLIAWRGRRPFNDALATWGRGWCWWLLPIVWAGGWVASLLAESSSSMQLLLGLAPFWFAIPIAGWLATLSSLTSKDKVANAAGAASAQGRHIPAFVWVSTIAYMLVWTALNWQLYFALNLPHGDSAMYEEHLWNLTHGKGFRSYLDQGLFLGEHIQVFHVLLIPLYVLWPSHLLLELCQSAALASGAIATFLLARRHTSSDRAGCCLAAAYLLYFPLHFLDISIDFKTFRPMSFSVPLVLFALDQLERGRWKMMLVLLALALSSKEDLAIAMAPLGVWIAVTAYRARPSAMSNRDQGFRGTAPLAGRRGVLLGLALAVFATVYLAAVVGWVIPAFRSGETVHYSRYFQAFGETPGEIVRTMMTDPLRVAREFLTLETLLYAAAMVVPLGLLPLCSPGRLAVGLPLFFLLCINEIGRAPHFHFHAPLVPIVVWAAAAGLGNVWRWQASRRRTVFHCVRAEEASKGESREAGSQGGGRVDEGGRSETPSYGRRWAAHFAWTSSLATGLFFSLGPLGMMFWDPASGAYWRKLYVPGERATRFAEIEPLIPREARVASTDFIHPRFTHHERSYDYSDYPRAVNANQPGAPPDTDFIVIDKRDRYRILAPPEKQIRSPQDLPEYRAAPDRWDVLVNDDCFLVLRHRDGRE